MESFLSCLSGVLFDLREERGATDDASVGALLFAVGVLSSEGTAVKESTNTLLTEIQTDIQHHFVNFSCLNILFIVTGPLLLLRTCKIPWRG